METTLVCFYVNWNLLLSQIQFFVTPMDYSMPLGIPVLHYLPEVA